MKPSLYNISWKVTEPVYRQDPALSYSTLAKYEREGFNKLSSLFDRIDTPSLTFGSAVDALITGGQEEFDNNFLVAEFPPITNSVREMTVLLFNDFSGVYTSITDIPNSEIIARTETMKYQLNWKPDTRAKVIKEQGFEYYRLMYIAKDKTIIDVDTNEKILAAVRQLKESEATKEYFAANDPFNPNDMERFYQLKFKATLEGVDVRCMADLIMVDHKNKIVYPCDLKTSSHAEWDFAESFVQWRYDIQGRLYWRIIRDNMNRDPEFKDYELADYQFIVVNKETLVPLVWKFEDTTKFGELTYGTNKQIVLRDPYDIAKELKHYLDFTPVVPDGITMTGTNSLLRKLSQL